MEEDYRVCVCATSIEAKKSKIVAALNEFNDEELAMPVVAHVMRRVQACRCYNGCRLRTEGLSLQFVHRPTNVCTSFVVDGKFSKHRTLRV